MVVELPRQQSPAVIERVRRLREHRRKAAERLAAVVATPRRIMPTFSQFLAP